MKVLVIGSNGMLGKDLMGVISNTCYEVIGLSKTDLDITDGMCVNEKLIKINPNIVILSAAFTMVDKCEDLESLAYLINGEGAKNVASACKITGSKLFFISTDYVFDGLKDTSYLEDDLTNPKSTYGKSKLLGEKNIQNILKNYLIIRTSWLFGLGGRNFVDIVLKKGKNKEDLRVVNDQIGSPTHTGDLAEAIVNLIKTDAKGIINITNTGECTWYEFAKTIYSEIGSDKKKISSISTIDYGAKAPRPINSRLSSKRFEKITGYKLRHWKNALKDYLEKRNIVF